MALRQLKIKAGVAKRVHKELASYEKELTKQQEYIEKLKAEGKDEYTIRKQHEVLEETRQMIPDCIKRLKVAKKELAELLEKGDPSFEGTEDLETAQGILKEIESF